MGRNIREVEMDAGTNQRRVCWLIRMCLAWPKGHPARDLWPELADEFVASAWQPVARPN